MMARGRYIAVIVELLVGVIATFFLWLPTGPENSSFILNCLGKDDTLYFDFNYFTPVEI